MSIQEQNFWSTTLDPVSPSAPEAFPDSVDVAVVGAGFTGLSAARALAKRNVKVAVLEAETAGWGASSRNGGMVLTGLKLPAPTLIKRYGLDLVRRLYDDSLASINCVEQIVREENIECSFTRCGHLEVACKEAHFGGYLKSAALIKKAFNHDLRIIPKIDLRSEIGSDIYFGGLVDETSASLNPARYVAGLALAARRAGTHIYEHTPAVKIEPETINGAARFQIATPKGTLTAREVLLASGAYTGDVTPALQKKIIPIGSYIIVTEVLSGDLARELSPRNRMIYDSKHFLYYYRRTPDNRMLFGGRAAFFPETATTIQASAEILRRGMVDVYPQLRGAKVEYVWGGTLDFAFDVMPHAGKIDGMHFAVGYAGHGVAAATLLGTQLAARICGDSNVIPYATIKFPGAPIGLRSGHTWALPLAGAWYKILDFLT